ncbi:hypothetical protein ACLKA7_016327 [Drosophila subpalustris]
MRILYATCATDVCATTRLTSGCNFDFQPATSLLSETLKSSLSHHQSLPSKSKTLQLSLNPNLNLNLSLQMTTTTETAAAAAKVDKKIRQQSLSLCLGLELTALRATIIEHSNLVNSTLSQKSLAAFIDEVGFDFGFDSGSVMGLGMGPRNGRSARGCHSSISMKGIDAKIFLLHLTIDTFTSAGLSRMILLVASLPGGFFSSSSSLNLGSVCPAGNFNSS